MILLLTALIVLLFAAWNGFVLNWAYSRGEKRKKNSRLWHMIGFVVRTLVVAIPILVFLPNWDKAIISLFILLPISHAGYNTVINLVRGDKWYYISGKGSVIDDFLQGYYRNLVMFEIFIFAFGLIAYFTMI